jgi:hypothetical protein
MSNQEIDDKEYYALPQLEETKIVGINRKAVQHYVVYKGREYLQGEYKEYLTNMTPEFLHKICQYDKGKKQGKFYQYDPDGEQHVGTFKDDEIDGVYRLYRKKEEAAAGIIGQLGKMISPWYVRVEAVYDMGKEISMIVSDEKGKFQETIRDRTKRNKTRTKWFADGSKCVKIYDANTDKTVGYSYNSDGKMTRKREFLYERCYGRLPYIHGDYIWYDPDTGDIVAHYIYKNGMPDKTVHQYDFNRQDHAIKDGEITVYDTGFVTDNEGNHVHVLVELKVLENTKRYTPVIRNDITHPVYRSFVKQAVVVNLTGTNEKLYERVRSTNIDNAWALYELGKTIASEKDDQYISVSLYKN